MSEQPQLPKKKNNRTGLYATIAVAAVAAITAGAFLIPPLFNSNSEEELRVVKLGTTDGSQGHWVVLKDLLKAEGIDLQLSEYTEYPLPNPAVKQGSANGGDDLNSFQHLDYLSTHNVNTGDNLQPIGGTLIVPLPLYADGSRFKTLADIPAGTQVAIPDDPSNQARALFVLEDAGLITLLGEEATPTPAHVDTANSKVKVLPVAASATAAALKDPQVGLAIVNNNFAKDNNLIDNAEFPVLHFVDPSQPASWPYINIIAVKAEDLNNPDYLKVAELYHHKSVTDIVVKESGNTAIIIDPVNYPASKLQQWLKEIEEAKKAQ